MLCRFAQEVCQRNHRQCRQKEDNGPMLDEKELGDDRQWHEQQQDRDFAVEYFVQCR
jgi:hypothetical protein